MKSKIKKILHSDGVSWCIALLIIFSLLSPVISEMNAISPLIAPTLDQADMIVVVLFTIEYILRIYIADNRWKFIISFYGIVDFLAIMPFYFSFMNINSMTGLRLFRLLRFIRLLKLTRYNNAMTHMKKAFYDSKEELVISIVVLCLMIYFSAYVVFELENNDQNENFKNIADAFWWSISTVTTRGDAGTDPHTIVGRLFAYAVFIISLGLIYVPANIFASALTSIKLKNKRKAK